MSSRRSTAALLAFAVVLAGSIVPSGPAAGDTPRAEIPEDRYAMAGGCYTLGSGAGYVMRTDDGFALTSIAEDAEPFTFQATDLGSYLLYTTERRFLAAGEGVLAEVLYGATESLPGQIAGGVALEQTDAAADEVARSRANRIAGRGSGLISASVPSELADWVIDVAGGLFSLTLPATSQVLTVTPTGQLDLGPIDADSGFSLRLAEGCAAYPEIEVNVEGEPAGGETAFEETRGYLDAHLHMMAFEFLGGRARCGRPWHRYGVQFALVDCPDHSPSHEGSVLEKFLSSDFSTHSTDGWPTFAGWPKYTYYTHEQVYYRWLERAWRGGLRMFVNLLVDNNQLCKIYPFKRNSCNEMDGVRLQAQRIRELERYIDAQSGGPGEGWFRIVTDPFQAREVINAGKLAVVLGIEVSVPLDCGETLEIPRCDLAQIEAGLDEVYDLGVRQMEITNKFDNAFTGVTGDGGTTGIVVNQGNLGETSHYWKMETCDEHDGAAHDKRQMNFHDDAGTPDQITGRDALVGQILAATGTSGATQLYPEGPHCNTIGLTALGEAMIRGMVERGMIFDPDHMSARARTAAMDLLDELASDGEQPGVVSSHSWADDTIYPRIISLGGVVTPHAGSSSSFVGKWRQQKTWADPRYPFGIGFGSDVNGFSRQGGPRGANVSNPVTYPFTGFGGVEVHRQVSGTRTYDYNADGIAHYGLYADWVRDAQILAGADATEFSDDLARGPEVYLQMWERAIGIAPNACRSDVADLEPAAVSALPTGIGYVEVLEQLGQPDARAGSTFSYCVDGDLTGTVTFDGAGLVASVDIA